MLAGIVALAIGIAAIYFAKKYEDKVQEGLVSKVGWEKWGARIGTLLAVAFVTGGVVKITEGANVLEYVVPILTFMAASYYVIIRPTQN